MERLQPPPNFDFKNPEEWPKWFRRFERFRTASGLDQQSEANQVNTLLYTMGDDAEDIITSLRMTDAELGKYDTVTEKLNTHFVVRRNVIFERAKFNQRQQETGESVESFITALHCLSEHCGYGQLHDEMIRDRIVVGLRDKRLSEQLQIDPDLTLEKAVTRVRQSELVKKQQDMLKSNFKTEATGANMDSVRMQQRPFIKERDNKPQQYAKKQFQKKGVQPQSQAQGDTQWCKWCGRTPRHSKQQCPAKDAACKNCNKKGHYAKVCRSGAVREVHATGEEEPEIAYLGSVSAQETEEAWRVKIKVNDHESEFRIDTGADVTAIPESVYQEHGQFPELRKSDRALYGAGRNRLHVRGKFTAELKTHSTSTVQDVYVVTTLKTGLLGRAASVALGLVARVDTISLNSTKAVKEQFPKLFTGLGKLEGEYKIELKTDAKPFALSTPRRVPLPLMPKVKQELARMEEMGVISRVEQPTDWCAGMVTVPKPTEKEVRICVDLTKLNHSVKRERHMLPAVEHTLGQLGGAKVFSKLDANSGFWQIPLAKESALLTTFITPFGRFCFNRLCFGISSAPEHFQKRMSQILEGLEGVICQMDDILVYAQTQALHDERLHAVLKRLEVAGVTLKSEKCEFSTNRVKFLGQIIDATGVKADPDKVKAVTDMREPTDVSGVRRFLGMVNHLGKYLPHLADKTQPIRDLLRTKNMWTWGPMQQRAFDDIKRILSSPPGLALYNTRADTVVSADASSFGLGAVLLQRQNDQLKPVAYASRALTDTEQRYAQIEKEALAITWACERFSDFLVGITFHVETDHKPLVPLLGAKNLDELPVRIQRLRMRLMRFSYSISHVAGKNIATADVLSRAPVGSMSNTQQEKELDLYVNMLMSTLPATDKKLEEIKEHQKRDDMLRVVRRYCTEGWPDRFPLDCAFRPYQQFAGELTVQNGLLLKGSRLVIPKSLQTDILQKLHVGHQGITKCRERAKKSVWWPGLSMQLQKLVERCDICARERVNFKETLLPTEFPDRPWATVGTDLFEWRSIHYLLVIDYFSRYIEIAKLTSTTSAAVIGHLKSIFSRWGCPLVLRSDGGPQYSSDAFKQFAATWGFTHITSSPRFPQSNGEAERAVRTIKELLARAEDPYMALMAYRATPLANGYSPAELLMGRRIRTTVPVIPSSLDPKWADIPKLKEGEGNSRQRQQQNFNKRHRAHDLPDLQRGDHVWVTDTKEKGTVLARSDMPRSYILETPRGILRRNRNHLVSTPVGPTRPADLPDILPYCDAGRRQPAEQSQPHPQGPEAGRRYPARVRRPPRYLKDFEVT